MTTYDRLKAGMDAVVQALTARVDYMALYPSRVVKDNGDGTLELVPDNTKLPGLSRVPMRLGIPGVDVKVNAGTRVLLGFEAGNPGMPVATLWEKESLKEIVITADTKVTVACSDVHLGGAPATQPLIQGSLYTNAEITMLGLLSTALGAVAAAIPSIGTLIPNGPVAASACATAAAAVTAFASAIPATLSTKVKTQ